jgi:hypothetical protein
MAEPRSRRVAGLEHAIRQARIVQAEANDVASELHEAEQARLELLGEALERIAKDIPPQHDQLLLGVLPGRPPRFWVDATSFVMIGRDKRQYRFVKDTRLGRTVLKESSSLEVTADAVTRYVAERIVEREQAVEADWLTRAVRRGGLEESRKRADNQSVIWALCGFGLGMISGMFLLLAYAWFSVG